MSSRLLTAGGDYLVDADGNYLVWELGLPGSMSLVVSGPSMTLVAAGSLAEVVEALSGAPYLTANGEVLTVNGEPLTVASWPADLYLTDEFGVVLTDELDRPLTVIGDFASPSIDLTVSAPTITFTLSED